MSILNLGKIKSYLSMVSYSREFKFPDKLDNMQLGCVWAGKHIVTVSLDGNLNFLDKENPSSPAKVVQVAIMKSSKFSSPAFEDFVSFSRCV